MNAMGENARLIASDPRWASVAGREAAADGEFYYAVKTTGVYCRPSCAARRARPENVQFFETRTAAERAGFRPCRRCKPDQASLAEQHAATITRICRLIEQSDEKLNLNNLAVQAGMSAYYFHRVFKKITGVTAASYAATHRARKVRARLNESASVTDAIYDAGFNSSARFYEKSSELLGMTPSRFRAGGAEAEIHFAIGECSLGSILVARTKRGVCGILLGRDPKRLVRDLQDQFPKARLVGGEKGFEQLVAKVVGFVEQPALGLDLPLDIRGTAFQQRVWQALREIPVGATASYAEIARKIGRPRAVRAVGRAIATNSLAVAIPCHRVIRTDGSLCGYRWGVELKRALLDRESRAKKA